ncbi:MAG: hypothetical protein A2017_15565 [Lentisphaerae bacterium GWF2_44_16]|nr:MAG: hypothetical protein A2017_15565 [Lentisphaerae bacterium GWF2_44_16]
MKKYDITVLSKTFCRILEQTAFMFAEEADKNRCSLIDNSFFCSTISFKGPSEGNITLCVPEGISSEIAANILGIETGQEISGQMLEDTVKELTNILCGQFITDVEGTVPVFKFSPPVMKKLQRENWRALLNSANSTSVKIDEIPLILNLEM